MAGEMAAVTYPTESVVARAEPGALLVCNDHWLRHTAVCKPLPYCLQATTTTKEDSDRMAELCPGPLSRCDSHSQIVNTFTEASCSSALDCGNGNHGRRERQRLLHGTRVISV